MSLFNKIYYNMKFYPNAQKYKTLIYKDNCNKSGIYKWTNKTNNKFYIGSAVDLTKRLKYYFIPERLKRNLLKSRSLIYSSILKYDYNNFSLEILEYCESKDLITKEQYYLDLLKPEYNICKTAGNTLGRKFSEDTKRLISNALTGKKVSVESILKSSQARKGKNYVCPCKLGLITIVINNKNNETKVYKSISAAAKDINCHNVTLWRRINSFKTHNKIYLIFTLDFYINNYKGISKI